MTKELENAFANIAIAVEQFKGTKQEHIALEQYLALIKQELSKEPCACKVESNNDNKH